MVLKAETNLVGEQWFTILCDMCGYGEVTQRGGARQRWYYTGGGKRHVCEQCYPYTQTLVPNQTFGKVFSRNTDECE